MIQIGGLRGGCFVLFCLAVPKRRSTQHRFIRAASSTNADASSTNAKHAMQNIGLPMFHRSRIHRAAHGALQQYACI